MATNANIFSPANLAIINDIKKELRLQGHHFKGALEASLRSREIAEAGGITLTAESLGYLEDLEKGIHPSNIDLGKIDYNQLAEWVRIKSIWRGCSPKQALKIAFAIAKKWTKEGFELEGAKAFSQTGIVDKAVFETFNKNQDRYVGMIDTEAIGSLDNSFSSIKSGTV